MDLKNLQDSLLINQNALDYEIMHQAQTYNEIGIATVEAKSEADALYEAYKNTDATLNISVREELTALGTKFTEAIVAAKVATHPDHVTAYQDYLNAKLVADKLSVLKDAYSQRSSMLRDLVSLFSSSYWTKDSISATSNSDIGTEIKKHALTNARNSEASIPPSNRRIIRKQKETVND